MTGSWDPTQYERYSGHRSRPARELLNRVDHDHPRHVVDLGCGTGDMARAMKQRWPQARGVAVDRSVKMLSTAVEAGGEVEWREADIAQLTPDNPVDVLYSNAALQWLPDHQMRFPGLISFLGPGGVLAVQMPLSWSEPSHILMRETLETGDRRTGRNVSRSRRLADQTGAEMGRRAARIPRPARTFGGFAGYLGNPLPPGSRRTRTSLRVGQGNRASPGSGNPGGVAPRRVLDSLP